MKNKIIRGTFGATNVIFKVALKAERALPLSRRAHYWWSIYGSCSPLQIQFSCILGPGEHCSHSLCLIVTKTMAITSPHTHTDRESEREEGERERERGREGERQGQQDRGNKKGSSTALLTVWAMRAQEAHIHTLQSLTSSISELTSWHPLYFNNWPEAALSSNAHDWLHSQNVCVCVCVTHSLVLNTVGICVPAG